MFSKKGNFDKKARVKNGFATLSTLILFSLIGFAAYFIISRSLMRLHDEQHKSSTFRIDVIKNNLLSQIRSDIAWFNSVQDTGNTSLQCLRAHSDCAGQGGLFLLNDATGKLYYDARPPGNGFTLSGDRCNSFSDVGNSQCPIRIDLTWAPACPAPPAPCIDPKDVTITGTFKFRLGAASKVALSEDRFSLKLQRASMANAFR